MKSSKLDARGIVSHLLLGIVSVGIVIGVALVVVLKANHPTKSVNQTGTQASTTAAKSKLNGSVSAQKVGTVAGTPGSPTPTPTPGKSTSTQPKQSTSPTPSTTPTPAPAETPLHALTTIIANLENGISAQVTANSVTVPGPISDAQARPIVFTVNGQVYFAYTQGSPPNFNTTPAQTAGTMAIVPATVSGAPLISAYLDKSNNLTDPNFHADGYSTGGN